MGKKKKERVQNLNNIGDEDAAKKIQHVYNLHNISYKSSQNNNCDYTQYWKGTLYIIIIFKIQTFYIWKFPIQIA